MPVAASDSAAPPQQARTELADVFARYADGYFDTHGATQTQRKVARAIVQCRTAALGGHREWCRRCGYQRYLYHSCRNRHCSKCQSLAKASWLEKRQAERLPIGSATSPASTSPAAPTVAHRCSAKSFRLCDCHCTLLRPALAIGTPHDVDPPAWRSHSINLAQLPGRGRCAPAASKPPRRAAILHFSAATCRNRLPATATLSTACFPRTTTARIQSPSSQPDPTLRG